MGVFQLSLEVSALNAPSREPTRELVRAAVFGGSRVFVELQCHVADDARSFFGRFYLVVIQSLLCLETFFQKQHGAW